VVFAPNSAVSKLPSLLILLIEFTNSTGNNHF
jgi:hypothetical protein